MGLSRALFTGISGLSNHQLRMDSIGNNISNVNTTGFKKGVHQFKSLLSQTIQGGTAAGNNRGGINPLAVGLGTATSSIRSDYGQGNLQTTGNQRDMAIDGNGYFVLDTGIEGDVWGRAYTRDGSFYLSEEGKLLGGEGLHVMGYQADTDGSILTSTSVDHISIPIGKTGGTAETTEVGMSGNMNSDVEVAAANVITTSVLAAGAFPAANTDPTWVATNGNDINVGHVETSAALWDTATGAAAEMTADLANLQFLRGTNLVQPFLGIAAGDEISISYEKGGRDMDATFTYGAAPNGDGTDLAAFMTFLTGGVGDDANGVNDQRLLGGAMGTIHTQQRTVASDGYDLDPETAGSFLRKYIGGAAPHAGAADYNNDGTVDNTTKISIASNLGEENAITDIAISFNSVSYTDMFSSDSDYGSVQGGSTSTSIVVYDSLGNPKEATMQMTLVARDTNFSTWRWVADSTDDTDATWNFGAFNDPAAPTTSINIGTGLIRFDQQGRYVKGVELSATGGLEIDRDDMGTSEPIQIGIQEGLSADQAQDLDFSDMTSVAAANDFNLDNQDGSASGTLDSFTVTSDGIINGVYSNGVIEVLGQIAVALVPNPNGMIDWGSNLFIEGAASGEPQVSVPQSGGRGSIRSGHLELSNVDLSEEFTNMIVTQRGFQANARIITTSDEMLQELVNLKR